MNEKTVYYGLDDTEYATLANLHTADPIAWGPLYSAFSGPNAISIDYGGITYHLAPVADVGQPSQSDIYALWQEDVILDNFYQLSKQWVGEINP